jgi:hypothetical protein
LYDWCDLLVTNGGGMVATHPPQFSIDNAQIGAAWVSYDMAGNYAAGLTRTGTYTVEFPALCMREFGARGDVCNQLQTQLVSTSAHKNLLCAANPTDPAGCVCQYDVSVQSGGSGTYQPVSANKLVHVLTTQFPQRVQTADFPQYATYCNKGTALQLTGSDGEYLFDEPGLRTLDLVSTTINCADGMKGTGEDGVDCGLACPMDCVAPAPPPAQ